MADEEDDWEERVGSMRGMALTMLGEMPMACHNRCSSINTNNRLLEKMEEAADEEDEEEEEGGEGENIEAPAVADEEDRWVTDLLRARTPSPPPPPPPPPPG